MKFYLAICIVILVVAVVTNGLRKNEVAARSITSQIDKTFDCIKAGVQRVKAENPGLEWWFENYEQIVTEFYAESTSCASLPFWQIRECFENVKQKALLEHERLAQLLPVENRHVADTVRAVILNCKG